MTWFVLRNWAFIAILFVILNTRRMPEEQMIRTGVLCALWPLLLLLFLAGTAL